MACHFMYAYSEMIRTYGGEGSPSTRSVCAVHTHRYTYTVQKLFCDQNLKNQSPIRQEWAPSNVAS